MTENTFDYQNYLPFRVYPDGKLEISGYTEGVLSIFEEDYEDIKSTLKKNWYTMNPLEREDLEEEEIFYEDLIKRFKKKLELLKKMKNAKDYNIDTRPDRYSTPDEGMSDEQED